MTDERSPQRDEPRPPAPGAAEDPADRQPAAATMAPADEQPPEAAQERARDLVDGDWHRLHPATPLLRGGLAVIVVGAVVLNSLRDRIVAFLLPDQLDYDDEGLDAIEAAERLASSGTLIWVLAGLAGVLALCIVGFWLAWRVHRFRVTGDVVEVRQGILFRTHRRSPLARIQGVNVEKPWFARLFGACKLEVQSAGADANVELAYLSNGLADALRYEILARAAGRDTTQHQQQQGSHAQRVVDDFLRPDAEVAHLAPSSLVRLRPRTVVLSSLLDLGLVLGVLIAVAAVVAMIVLDIPWLLFTLIPAVLSIISITVRTLSQKLRFSIGQTPDGIRLAYGLLSTTTEVLPAGRVFSITVAQPLLWRPMGWWKVSFTRATKTTDGSSGQQKQYANVLLPVGTREEVDVVLGLVLPALRGTRLLDDGLVGRGRQDADADATAEDGGPAVVGDAAATDGAAPVDGIGAAGADGYVTTPRSARVLRPLSWRRNGVAIGGDAILLRRGRIWRSLGIVPLARTQSFAMHQGPLEGALGVAHVAVHVVGNAFSPTIGALAVDDAQRVFARARDVVPAAIGADTTETWHVRTPGAEGDDATSAADAQRPSEASATPTADPATPSPSTAEPATPSPLRHPGVATPPPASGDEHRS